MNSKLLFFIFIFGGSALTVQSQTPDLQAVTVQGNITTRNISIWTGQGLTIVTDPGNLTLATHWLKGSPDDPGVLRFDCGSQSAAAAWEFYNSNKNKSLLYLKHSNSFVGIGTTDPKARLAVNGEVLAKKVRITPKGWADYVFEPSYNLPSLEQLKRFISKHKHLPDIPSAKNVAENDLDLGGNQANLLKKIEEMTLYLIAQQKQLEERVQRIRERQQLLEDREKRVSALEAKVGNE